ncbi:hypothetical protein TRVL_07272 [Trypanosoma vivax]|nr:hypothetical protein TRVL_07272 [Trypanosoma vivax]
MPPNFINVSSVQLPSSNMFLATPLAAPVTHIAQTPGCAALMQKPPTRACAYLAFVQVPCAQQCKVFQAVNQELKGGHMKTVGTVRACCCNATGRRDEETRRVVRQHTDSFTKKKKKKKTRTLEVLRETNICAHKQVPYSGEAWAYNEARKRPSTPQVKN